MKEAVQIANDLRALLKDWEPRLKNIPADVLNDKKNSQNRTVKQITGHLIDSTSNNIHRIVHLHYQPSPFDFPNYASFGNNDRWIAIQHYQEEDWNNMIELLKYLVYHYCHLIMNIDDKKLGNQWIAGPGRLISMEDMVVDFLRHFKLHLSEIEELLR